MVLKIKDSLDRGLSELWELKIENYFVEFFYHKYSWNDLLSPTCLGIIYGRPLTENVRFIYYSGLEREGLVGLVLLFFERVEFV